MSVSDSLERILVVVDETPVREVLSEYFLAHGYAVETAENGAEAQPPTSPGWTS